MLDSENTDILATFALDTLIRDFHLGGLDNPISSEADIRNVISWLLTLPVESLLDYIPCDHPVIQGRGKPITLNLFDLPSLVMDQEYIDTNPMYTGN